MSLNQISETLDKAAIETGNQYSFSYTTKVTTKGALFIMENNERFKEVASIEELEVFLSEAKPAKSKLDSLISKRDQLQKEIDEMSNETLVCNKG